MLRKGCLLTKTFNETGAGSPPSGFHPTPGIYRIWDAGSIIFASGSALKGTQYSSLTAAIGIESYSPSVAMSGRSVT